MQAHVPGVADARHGVRGWAIPLPVRGLGRLLGRTLESWWNDNAMRLGASLAYYTVFSLTPFLVVVIAVAGLVVDSAVAEQRIMEQIGNVLGADGAVAVAALLKGARRPGAGGFAAVTSVVTIVLGATAVFSELQSGLNGIWRVPATNAGWGRVVVARLRSFALVVGIGFLFLVSLVLQAVAAAVQAWVGSSFLYMHDTLALIMSALMFGMIFKVLPETPVAWRDVAVGALVTAALFTVGQWALGRYLGTSSIASVYGAAGSLVVILLWVYYSAQVFFLGAEFTHVYATTYGSRAGAFEAERAGALAPPSDRLPDESVVRDSAIVD
jgi:membrane protein